MMMMNVLQLVILGIVAITTTANTSAPEADQQQQQQRQQVITVPITRSTQGISEHHSRFRRNAATKKAYLYNENDKKTWNNNYSLMRS